MRLIGIVGKKRAGKDTAASALVERGFIRVGFADAVKENALKLNPIIDMWSEYPDSELHPVRLANVIADIGWERAKDEYPEVRAFLQRHGDGTRQILGDDVWIDAWARTVEALAPGAAVVAADVRYLNEAGHIRALGGLVVRVERSSIGAYDDHVSETEQDHIHTDVTLVNAGTVADLRRAMVTASR